MQARVKGLHAKENKDICTATQALLSRSCQGARRNASELGRFDADVEHINEVIAVRCS
jgi:hypothetical protein